MNNLRKYIVDEIIGKLEDYEGVTEYGCDLAYTLFAGENANGSYTCSTYEAKQWIQEHFDDLGEVVEDLNFQFGDSNVIPNVFENPEAFQVVIIIEGASYLLSKCKTIDELWNEEFELTPELIEKITKDLEEIKDNNSYNFYI